MSEISVLVRALPVADRTMPWNGSEHRTALQACEEVYLYPECGWSCLIGYQVLRDSQGKKYDTRRVLHLHFNSDAERSAAITGSGMIVAGGRIRPMTDAEQNRHRNARSAAYRTRGKTTDVYSETHPDY